MLDRARLLRFTVVGLATAAIYYGLLVLCVEWLGVGAVLSSAVCYVVAVLFNYQLHYRWTFAARGDHRQVGARYVVMLAGGFALNAMVMFAGVSLLGWHYLLVQTFAIGLITVWNFMLSSLWVFRH